MYWVNFSKLICYTFLRHEAADVIHNAADGGAAAAKISVDSRANVIA